MKSFLSFSLFVGLFIALPVYAVNYESNHLAIAATTLTVEEGSTKDADMPVEYPTTRAYTEVEGPDDGMRIEANTGTGATTIKTMVGIDTLSNADNDSLNTDRKALFLKDVTAEGGIFLEIKGVEGESEDISGSDSADDARDIVMIDEVEDGDRVLSGKDNRNNIIIKSVTVRGWDPEKKQELEDLAPGSISEVKTENDLILFLTHGAEENEYIEEVALNFEAIIINYNTHGKFLGLIPFMFVSRAEIDTNPESKTVGRVKVKFPWYRFLTKLDVTGEAIEQEANDQSHKEWIVIDSWSTHEEENGHLGIVARAQAFSMLSNILKTRHDTVKNSIGNIR